MTPSVPDARRASKQSRAAHFAPVPLSDYSHRMSDGPFNATLIYREDIDAERAIVRVRPDSGAIPQFTAGQFIMLGLPKPAAMERTSNIDVVEAELSAVDSPLPPRRPARPDRVRMFKRAYSIASPPTQREFLEFFVVLVGGGRLTPLLWPINEGGRLWIDDACKGEFTLDAIPAGKDLWMISTGTGIAPFRSMLLAHRDNPPWRRLVMINGVRHAAELGYRAEMEQLARESRWFTYIPMLSRDPNAADHGCVHGRVQRALDPEIYESHVGAALTSENAHVFLCGNPEMIDATQTLLETRGFTLHSRKSPGNIHFERYW